MGEAAGGNVPLAPRGVNLAPDFSKWTLSGATVYDELTGELSFTGSSGVATSPLIKVDGPTSIYIGGDMYATIPSEHESHTPRGAFHDEIKYFKTDGETPAVNTWGYTQNGCARSFDLSVWNMGIQECDYGGGSEVVYIKYTFIGPSGGRTSRDIKIKNPLLIVKD